MYRIYKAYWLEEDDNSPTLFYMLIHRMPLFDAGLLELLVAKAKSSQNTVLQFYRPDRMGLWRW